MAYLHSHVLGFRDSSDSKERYLSSNRAVCISVMTISLMLLYLFTRTVVWKSRPVFHFWELSFFLSQREKLKWNKMWTQRGETWLLLCKIFWAIFTFSFGLFRTKVPEEVFLSLQLHFWLGESEVHGLPVLWLTDREAMAPDVGVTVTTHMWVECLHTDQSIQGQKNTIYHFLVLISLWIWTSKQDSGFCGCLHLKEG